MIVGELERPEHALRWPPARRTAPRCLRLPPPPRRGATRTADAATQDLSLRSVFVRAKKLERQYAARLRSVATVVDHLVRGFEHGTRAGLDGLHDALRAYAARIDPWARTVAARMIAEVAARDERSWFRVAATMGASLRREIATAPTGALMSARLEDQVVLIRSLPEDAAARVRALATEYLPSGTRAEELRKRILETGAVTRARATTIARTETTRTATELTRVRAEHAGSTHFRWVTAGDAGVRKSHARLNGTVHEWGEPPICDAPDIRALPGCVFNCRCWAEPILTGVGVD